MSFRARFRLLPASFVRNRNRTQRVPGAKFDQFVSPLGSPTFATIIRVRLPRHINIRFSGVVYFIRISPEVRSLHARFLVLDSNRYTVMSIRNFVGRIYSKRIHTIMETFNRLCPNFFFLFYYKKLNSPKV